MSDSDDYSFNSAKSEGNEVNKLDDSIGEKAKVEESGFITNPTKIIPGQERDSQVFQIENNEESKKNKENKNVQNKGKDNEKEGKKEEKKKNIENINNNKSKKEEIKEEDKINELNEKKDIKINLDETNKLMEESISRKIKNFLNVEIDKEKTQQKGYTIYQISLFNSKYSKNDEIKILCYRRYKDFEKFYSVLKIRYPQYIFPRLSQKNFVMSKVIENPEFIENRRKQLKYFINRLYLHDKIGKSEEFKKFINDSVFDNEYYNNIPIKFIYPECTKAKNDKSYLSQGVSKISSFFTGLYKGSGNEYKESENEKKILSKESDFKNKSLQYNNLLKEIKILYDSTQEEIKEYEIIGNNLLYLKDGNSNNNKEIDYNKQKFNELVEINKNYADILKDKSKFLLEEIIDPLNNCLLDVEGVNKALERYISFIKEFQSLQGINPNGNKYILEEKSRADNDKKDYEISLVKDLQNYEKTNSKIYQDMINKITLYLKSINEYNLVSFQRSNFGNN